MMLPGLVARNLLKHKLRTCLIGMAAAVAIFLLVMLRSIVTSLDDAVKAAAGDRIVTLSAVSLFVNLPLSYRTKIEAVEGVKSVIRYTWFGGRVADESKFFSQFAIDAEPFFAMFPECEISEEQKRNFLADKAGCIIGDGVAKLLEPEGIVVGSKLPVLGTIYPKETAWEFNVHGIYTANKANFDGRTMYFHADYLEEGRKAIGEVNPADVGVFWVQVKDGYRPEDVGARIDNVFAAGPLCTSTQTEAQFAAGFVSMWGVVIDMLPLIGMAVLFALLIMLVNTMLIASRERVRDVGILKALGFRKSTIAGAFVLESALLTGVGGALGIAAATAVAPGVRQAIGAQIQGFGIRPSTYVEAAVVITVMCLAAAALPAVNAWRLKAVDALRMEM